VTDLAAKLADVLRELESPDSAARVAAVEDLAQIANQIVDRVLEEFAKPGPARYLIFERLGRFGSLVVEPLEQLLVRSEDQELQVLTAAALLSLGSRAGVGVLLDAVRVDNPYVCLAVRVLADRGIAEAATRMEEAVYQCDITETALVECLVGGLRCLVDPLPDGVLVRLQSVEPAWLRDSLVR
jgi:hypothetical protein